MQLTVESIQNQIPYYLTRAQKEGLVKALADFPKGMNYYTLKHDSDLLQGDGWTALQAIRFETGERKGVQGLVLSNSCDIDPQNPRAIPVRLVFVPIIKLDAYENLLKGQGIEAGSISRKIGAIREQLVTSMFFLPKGGQLNSDYIAVLDDIHAMPSNAFLNDGARKKVFTLSQAGFYLFLLKLSIHFCRFHENVARD